MALIITTSGSEVRLDAFVTGDLEPIGSLTVRVGKGNRSTVDLDRDQMTILRDGLTALIDRRS